MIRTQRVAAPAGDPPERDIPGLIGRTGLDGLDEDALLTRLERITALEAMLAAERVVTLAGFAAVVSGASADLGHDNPRPGDRPARGAERRWHNGLLRSVADETGLAMGLQRRAAARRINVSVDLVTRFPLTQQWLSDGRLPERAALTIAAELGGIQDPQIRRRIEQKVLEWVERYGPMRVKKVARREAAKATAEKDSNSYDARLDQRMVQMRPVDSGVAELALTCSAIDAVAVVNSLSAAAIQIRNDNRRSNSEDERNLDQLRTDIAIQRLLGRPTRTPDSPNSAHATGTQPPQTGSTPEHGMSGLAGGAQPHHHTGQAPNAAGAADEQSPRSRAAQAADTAGVAGAQSRQAGDGEAYAAASGTSLTRTEIVIHCTAAEAIALSTGTYTTGGDLDGHGPLPQPALWEAFRTAKIRYRLTDREPVGDPDRYTPSVALAQHVVDRDRTCRASGCGHPASRCDIDHRREFPHGPTDCHNCAAFCRHDHRLKHRGGWKVERLPSGEHTWTSPTGRVYLTPPPDHG